MKVSTETQILSKEQVHFNGSIQYVNHQKKLNEHEKSLTFESA